MLRCRCCPMLGGVHSNSMRARANMRCGRGECATAESNSTVKHALRSMLAGSGGLCVLLRLRACRGAPRLPAISHSSPRARRCSRRRALQRIGRDGCTCASNIETFARLHSKPGGAVCASLSRHSSHDLEWRAALHHVDNTHAAPLSDVLDRVRLQQLTCSRLYERCNRRRMELCARACV
jgi:hypothetical protein